MKSLPLSFSFLKSSETMGCEYWFNKNHSDEQKEDRLNNGLRGTKTVMKVNTHLTKALDHRKYLSVRQP